MKNPATMKVTPAKRRVLTAMLKASEAGRDQGEAAFRFDMNGTCYSSLQDYGMVEPPGVLTDEGRKLAIEIRDAEKPQKRPAPMF